METLPFYISIIFILTVILTTWLFYRATRQSSTSLIIILSWILVHSIMGFTGFYTITNTLPPRFLLMVAPPMLLIIGLFASSKGRKFIDSLDLKSLTFLHTIRIPVELVLYWLFLQKTVPELMTFEGRNLDILSGISALVITYFYFTKKQTNLKTLLIWNFICLGLLVNIVVNAVLSAPSPFQQFAFDQPNIAVLYFPFNLLPAVVVPLVLFSHLAAVRQLIKK